MKLRSTAIIPYPGRINRRSLANYCGYPGPLLGLAGETSRENEMDQVIEFVGNHALLAGGFGAALVALVYTEGMRMVRGLKELSPAQAVPWINDPDAVVIDVSAAADFNKGHIVDARNMPASRLAKPDAEILKLKDKKVLLVDKSGQAAVPAAISLLKMGVSNIAVLKGGMVQWRSDQFPVTRK